MSYTGPEPPGSTKDIVLKYYTVKVTYTYIIIITFLSDLLIQNLNTDEINNC